MGLVETRTDDGLIEQAAALERYKKLLNQSPGWRFRPHTHGQLQALKSDKIYRYLIPGNGFGKTSCMAMDAEMLLQATDPFKAHVLPKSHPATAAWFCQKYQQYEIMRRDIESHLTRTWTFHEQKKFYSWPNGARLFLLSSDSDWSSVQGIHLDAVYFDEHPDRRFWIEMMFRRRGEYKTRYMVAATMTQGITWFIQEEIKPWEQAYKRQGLTEDQALEQQPHPTKFVWTKGGIEDNPGLDQSDVAHYDSITVASDKELMVRRYGGYADFVGEPVFDIPSLQAMAADLQAGEEGILVFRPDSEPRIAERLPPPPPNKHRFWGALDPIYFRWIPGAQMDGGRITLYEAPHRELAGNYFMGMDFAAGLIGKDYDTVLVGVKKADGRCYQVAEAMGHWGDIAFAEVVYALAVIYHNAFMCGERQFGLPTLRRLFDEMGYTYQFSGRLESTRARRQSDMLGHHRADGDTIIPMMRKHVKSRDLVIRSADTLTQLKRYQFQPRNKSDTIDDVTRSEGLKTSAPSGEFDDLVMAAAYMMHAAREMVHYTPPKPPPRIGSMAQVLNLEETLDPKPKRPDSYGPRR